MNTELNHHDRSIQIYAVLESDGATGVAHSFKKLELNNYETVVGYLGGIIDE